MSANPIYTPFNSPLIIKGEGFALVSPNFLKILPNPSHPSSNDPAGNPCYATLRVPHCCAKRGGSGGFCGDLGVRQSLGEEPDGVGR